MKYVRNVRDTVFDRVKETPDISLEEATNDFKDRELGWAIASWHYANQTQNQPNPFYPAFDPEVRELCKVINQLPGIKTTGSCCGHGKYPAWIILKVDFNDPRGLILLTRCADRRYWKYGHKWDIKLSISDTPSDPIIYWLESHDVGEPAYQQIQSLIKNIQKHRQHHSFLKGYGLFDLKL